MQAAKVIFMMLSPNNLSAVLFSPGMVTHRLHLACQIRLSIEICISLLCVHVVSHHNVIIEWTIPTCSLPVDHDILYTIKNIFQMINFLI